MISIATLKIACQHFLDAPEHQTDENENWLFRASYKYLGQNWNEESKHLDFLLKATNTERVQYLIDQLKPL